MIRYLQLALIPCFLAVHVVGDSNEVTVPAVRVVRLQVDYRNASVSDLQKIHKFVFFSENINEFEKYFLINLKKKVYWKKAT